MPAGLPDGHLEVVEAAPDAVLIVTDGRIAYANPAAERLFGTEDPTGLVGRPLVTLLDGASYRRILAALLAANAGPPEPREPFRVNLLFGDEEHPCEAVVALSASSSGAAALVFLRDLTRLQEAELGDRWIAETTPDAVISIDASGTIVSWNRAAQRMFGYRQEEAVGRPLTMLIPPRYREAHEGGLARANATGKGRLLGGTVELAALRADGGEFPIELSLATSNAGGRRRYTGIVRDITRRKQAEDALHREETRYRALFEHSPAALLEMDLQAVVGWMNRLRSAGVTDLTDHLAHHPGDLRFGISLIRITRANHRAVQVLEARVEDELLGEVDPERFEPEVLWGIATQLVALWEGHEAHEAELRLTTRKETPIVCRVRWAVPVLMGEADWGRTVLVLDDVTERRAAEAAVIGALEDQRDFIASLAHELRTPLTAVLGFSEILAEGWRMLAPEEREELIELVARSSGETAAVLDDLFVAARGRIDALIISPRPVPLGPELEAVWSALPPELAARVELPEASPAVKADPPRLRQIVRSLCLAADRGPEVRVWLTAEEDVPRREVRIGVRHDGPVLPEPQTRILDGSPASPLPSLPELRMQVARQLAVLMGGTLSYRSGPLHGVFELVLPGHLEDRHPPPG